MQHIATDKSEFAALPFKVGTQKSQNINPQVDFQAFLREANPIYRQPVQPRVAVDRVSEPVNKSANQISSCQYHDVKRDDLNDRQQTPQQAEQDLKARSQTSTSEQPNGKSTGAEQGKPAQQTNQSDAEVANANKGVNQSTTDEAKANKSASRQQEGEQNLANNQQTSAGQEPQSTLNNASTIASDTDNIAGTSEAAAQQVVSEAGHSDPQADIDWLNLVESSLRAELSANSQVDSAPVQLEGDLAIAANPAGDITHTEIGLVDKLSANTEQNISIENDIIVTEQTVLVTEQQITADLAVQKEQAALATLAELLNTPTAGQHTIAKVDAAVEQLLMAQNSVAPQESKGDTDPSQSLMAAITSANQLITDTENLSDGDVATKLDAELLVAMAVPEQLAGKQSQNEQANKFKPDVIASAVDTKPVGLTDTLLEPSASKSKIAEDVTRLAKLPEIKLDAALANLADRLVTDADKGRNNALLQSLEKIGLGADPAIVKADFVSALKATVEEFKAQLQQGHQPSIDLSTMVADSLTKVTGVQVSAEQLSGTLSRFNQTLEVSNLLRAQSDHAQLSTHIEKVTKNDTLAQAQVTQNKQGQQIAQFDKAVNITRNEGLQQMAEKVRWMVNQNNLQAEIRLDPPDLGAMKVRINMAGDSATVNIVVQSQQARDVLEQATPRLKELLEQQGIELGQSSVHQEQGDNDAEQQEQLAGGHSEQQELPSEDTVHLEQPIRNGRIGGIDYFV